MEIAGDESEVHYYAVVVRPGAKLTSDRDRPTEMFTFTAAELDSESDSPLDRGNLPPYSVVANVRGRGGALPFNMGYANIDSRLFLVGVQHGLNVLSLDTAFLTAGNKTCTWENLRTFGPAFMRNPVVPHDGSLLIFLLRGGAVFVYDPRKNKLELVESKAQLVLDEPISHFHPFHYFTMENEGKKMIMLTGNPLTWLVSYDIEKNQWALVSTNLPPNPPGFPEAVVLDRNYIHLGGNLLQIIVSAACWTIYDMSDHEVVQQLRVKGMKKDGLVFRSFRSRCKDDDGSMKLRLFGSLETHPFDVGHEVRHASVRLKHDKGLGKWEASLDSEGYLQLGDYKDFIVFAVQTKKRRAAEDALLGEPNEEEKGHNI